MHSFVLRVVDLNKQVTVGVDKQNIPIPQDFVLVDAALCLKTAQTSGQDIKVNLTKDGVAALSAPLTIASGATKSVSAAAVSVLEFPRLSRLGVNVVQIGDGTAEGLDVVVYGYQPAGAMAPPTSPPVDPPPSSSSWVTLANPTFTSTSADLSGYNFRHVLSKTNYPAGLGAGTKIKVTLNPGSGTVSAFYVGHKGAAPSFDAAPVAMSFSSGIGEVTFTFNPAKDLVFSFQAAGGVDLATSSPGFTRYYKVGSGEAGSTTVSGYSSDGTHLLIGKVEAFV